MVHLNNCDMIYDIQGHFKRYSWRRAMYIECARESGNSADRYAVATKKMVKQLGTFCGRCQGYTCELSLEHNDVILCTYL